MEGANQDQIEDIQVDVDEGVGTLNIVELLQQLPLQDMDENANGPPDRTSKICTYGLG